jgi:hypothetical protein
MQLTASRALLVQLPLLFLSFNIWEDIVSMPAQLEILLAGKPDQ